VLAVDYRLIGHIESDGREGPEQSPCTRKAPARGSERGAERLPQEVAGGIATLGAHGGHGDDRDRDGEDDQDESVSRHGSSHAGPEIILSPSRLIPVRIPIETRTRSPEDRMTASAWPTCTRPIPRPAMARSTRHRPGPHTPRASPACLVRSWVDIDLDTTRRRRARAVQNRSPAADPARRDPIRGSAPSPLRQAGRRRNRTARRARRAGRISSTVAGKGSAISLAVSSSSSDSPI
jgi:hypothetical protein